MKLVESTSEDPKDLETALKILSAEVVENFDSKEPVSKLLKLIKKALVENFDKYDNFLSTLKESEIPLQTYQKKHAIFAVFKIDGENVSLDVIARRTQTDKFTKVVNLE